ncbi:MAG: carboxypeptidase-like regulatory domain-containing protein [Bacteroidales bacterium]|nr:carboxypeptidase-like regulatory domain-containing protein [Bacteroidales bacterium]
MKKIILFLLLVIFFQAGQSQIIKGTLLDKSDNQIISFASIYINGTSAGTHSDQNGYFELDISKYSSLPITVSALGYFTLTLTDFSVEKPIEIFLSPKTFELNEVVVAAKSTSKDRKANLMLFRNQFLGSGYNGKNCVITNEGDITFKNSGDTLKAYALNPILIVNNALGYKITYYLDNFEYCWKCKSFLYEGNAFFSEDMSTLLTSKNFFEKRRKKTYLGSRSHFFSSLWTNSLHSNGFDIKNSVEEIINYEDIVSVRAGFKKYLSSKSDLYIYYLSKSPSSCIQPLKDYIFFDSNGYFDGSGIMLSGQMAQQRIGDLLPYDFKLK